jgi:hypothetical protein
MNAWSATLHHYNYYSGYYSSMGSGGADQVAHYSATAYVRPDYIDYARWDGVATTTDVAVPSADWPGRRRMKQYSGGHTETYGGVTINIDDDYVDFAPLPSATMADYNRDGWSDLAARTKSNGDLYDYPGNGAYASDGYKFKIAGGLSSMNAIVRIGDLNRDGYPDFVMRTTSGSLYFYPGKSNGTLGTRRLLSTGFAKMREITAIGDLTKDGYPDLIAAQTSNHALYLYPGAAGDKLGPRKLIGSSGWQTMSELAGVGDFTKDGYPDLITKQTTTGNLYLYPGKKGTIGTGKVLATGFSGMRDLVGVGDFDRDGHTDLAAVLSSSGYLELYRGTGGALLPGVRLATGYGGRTSLA